MKRYLMYETISFKIVIDQNFNIFLWHAMHSNSDIVIPLVKTHHNYFILYVRSNVSFKAV